MSIKKKVKIPLLFILYFAFLWGGQLSSKMASSEISMVNYFLIPLYICFFSRAIIWFIILRNMDLIKAYTISSFNYIFIPFISYYFLGELIQLQHLIGGLFIITGIIFFRIGEQKSL